MSTALRDQSEEARATAQASTESKRRIKEQENMGETGEQENTEQLSSADSEKGVKVDKGCGSEQPMWCQLTSVDFCLVGLAKEEKVTPEVREVSVQCQMGPPPTKKGGDRKPFYSLFFETATKTKAEKTAVRERRRKARNDWEGKGTPFEYWKDLTTARKRDAIGGGLK